jgi:hypothetical protein
MYRNFVALLVTLLTLVSVAHSAETRVIDSRELMPYNIVNFALTAYWKAHGEFPAKWSDVVLAGLVQVELSVPGKGVVNPDDGELNFEGDVAYFGPLPDGTCSFGYMPSAGTNVPVLPVVREARVKPQSTTTLQDLERDPNPDLAALASDLGARRLIGLAFVTRMCYDLYYMTGGHGFENFLNSGFAPVDGTDINPWTGEKLNYDGAARNLQVGEKSPVIAVIGTTGNKLLAP